MILERSVDDGLIGATMAHPRIYPSISDDGCPAAHEFVPVMHPKIFYLAAYDDDKEYLGLFMLIPQSAAVVEVHTCLLPISWGEKAREAARMLIEWVWQNTEYQRIITQVAVSNPLAKRFALVSGMTEYGINPKAWLKNGLLFDVALLGITRPGA